MNKQQMQREMCWLLRDQLYECLENNNEDLEACSVPYKKLIDTCPASWTKRFIEKRKYDLEKKSMTYFVQRKEEYNADKLPKSQK